MIPYGRIFEKWEVAWRGLVRGRGVFGGTEGYREGTEQPLYRVPTVLPAERAQQLLRPSYRRPRPTNKPPTRKILLRITKITRAKAKFKLRSQISDVFVTTYPKLNPSVPDNLICDGSR